MLIDPLQTLTVQGFTEFRFDNVAVERIKAGMPAYSYLLDHHKGVYVAWIKAWKPPQLDRDAKGELGICL